MDYDDVYDTWLSYCRETKYHAIDRTIKATRLPEQQVRRIVRVVSRWRARQLLRQAAANNYNWIVNR